MSHSHIHHEHDYAAANRAHFDQESSRFDQVEGAIELSRRLGPVILAEYPFNEETTTVLDYACGTGLLSRELVSEAKSILGVDISQGMVDQYNLRVSNQGIPFEEMSAVCLELKGEEGELDNKKFDVIVCSMAYHHFSDINKTTSILARHLNPSGKLIVTEGKSSNGTQGEVPDKYKHIVAHHHGISEEALKVAFEGAGLKDFKIKDGFGMKLMGNDVRLFLATGVKN